MPARRGDALVHRSVASAARLIAGLLPLVMLACCNSVPTEQLKTFTASLSAVQEADKPIFADLAVAETRGQGNRADPCPDMPPIPLPGGSKVRDGFCMQELGTAAGDPPATAQFKAGMDALQLYTSTLNVLASNANGTDASAQLKTISGNLLGIASGLKLVGTAVGPEVSGVIEVLGALVDQAAAQLSKEEARRLILKGADTVHELIKKEKAAAPNIWNIVTSDWRDGLKRIGPHDIQGAKDLQSKVETYRMIVAKYVIMLDRLDAAWSKVVDATSNPQPATLAELAVLSGQLKTDSDTLTQAFATLRAGPATK